MKKFFLFSALTIFCQMIWAQNPRLAVINFDVTNTSFQTEDLTELLRVEISKHKKYEIIDRYEILEVVRKDNVLTSNCFSKTCLISAGKNLKADYVVTGSADKIGEALFLRIRLLSVQTGSIEKEAVKEFLMIPEKINTMITICVNDLVGVENEKMIVNSLSNKESYESAINNPYYQTLNLSGPRMGYSFIVGPSAGILGKPKSQGGFDSAPFQFQIGYQFEKQYLSEGKWQALVEFVPLISGMDQGLFIPSISILNGIRSNKNGLEFAIGPSLAVVQKADVYVVDGKNVLVPSEGLNDPNIETYKKLDSRGAYMLNTSVVIAAGYSLKSGKLNIPINAYFSPSKDDVKFGISFGFNTRK